MSKKRKTNLHHLFPRATVASSPILIGPPFLWNYQRERLKTLAHRQFTNRLELGRALDSSVNKETLQAAYLIILAEMGREMQKALWILESSHRICIAEVNKFYRVTKHPSCEIKGLLRENDYASEAQYFGLHLSLSEGLLMLSSVVQSFAATRQLASVGAISIPELDPEES